VARRLKGRLDALFGAGNTQLAVETPGPPSSGFTASATGRDPQALRKASDMLVRALSGDPELANLKSDLAAEKPELLVSVDPVRAAGRGLTPQAIAFIVSGALTPKSVGTLGPGGPVVVDFVERNRIGHSLSDALLRAGSVRLRPILMTAVATIVALVPVAAGVSTSGGGG
jgi:multidrug efflux pump subunit AcrB